MKQVTVNNKTLIAALATLDKVVPRRATLPVLQYVRMHAAPMSNPKEGINLFLAAADLVTYAIGSVPGHGDPFDPILVEHDALTSIMKKCPNGDTKLVRAADGVDVVYAISGQSIEAQVPTLSAEEFPLVPSITGEEFCLPDKFGAAYQRALPFRSSDETRYILNGVCIDNREGRQHLVATDGRRMFIEDGFDGVMQSGRHVIIPARCTILANGMLKKTGWSLTCQWGKDQNGKETGHADQILLRTDGWWIYTKPWEGDYPCWTQVVPAQGSEKAVITMDEKAAEKILNIVNSMPDWTNGKSEPTVKLSVDGGKLIVSTASGYSKTATATIEGVKAEGVAMAALNRYFLLDALRMLAPRIEMTDELSPLCFRGNGQTIIVMPMRMS